MEWRTWRVCKGRTCHLAVHKLLLGRKLEAGLLWLLVPRKVLRHWRWLVLTKPSGLRHHAILHLSELLLLWWVTSHLWLNRLLSILLLHLPLLLQVL